MSEDFAATFMGTVDQIIRNGNKDEVAKVQIIIDGADNLYREVRVPNMFRNMSGSATTLEEGDVVDVVIMVRRGATVEGATQ